jgi:2-polyprenyl-3-methyl-5-hydroxy-6-metoxy-1,4-benzoquinol methylase
MLVRSPGCGLEWQRPFPTPDALVALYGADYFERWGLSSGEDALARVRAMKCASYRSFLRTIIRYRPHGTLLDVGCALGFLVRAAQDAGFTAYGLDRNPDAIAHARQELGDRVQARPLGPDAFPGIRFDVVTLIDVIEHVSDPVALLAAVASVLAPQGIVAAVLPNAASLTRRILGRRWPHYAPEHLYQWTPAALRRFLDVNGYRVLELQTALRKTYTVEYLQAYSAALGGWLPPGLGLLRGRTLRIPTGEMLVIASLR